MERDLDPGPLEHGPHADLIRGLAERCHADPTVQAIWVGGSLAAGTGDRYSDVDFRIAVEPERLEGWLRPDWDRYLPLPSCGGTFLRFGEHALLHHLLVADGTIVDFYVQDTSVGTSEPKLVVVACRNEAFGEVLADASRVPAPITREIDADAARRLFVDYWITTHKEMKGLGRRHDHSHFVGLYFERVALLRAWHMEVVGRDIDARVSIHMLGAVNEGLDGELTAQRRDLLGLPSRTPEETVAAVEAIRAEMSRLGRSLARAHGFEYPHELEEVVLRTWDGHKRELVRR